MLKRRIESWYAIVKKASWQNLEEVKQTYKDAEAVGNFTVFNIKGNRYRFNCRYGLSEPNSILQIFFNSR